MHMTMRNSLSKKISARPLICLAFLFFQSCLSISVHPTKPYFRSVTPSGYLGSRSINAISVSEVISMGTYTKKENQLHISSQQFCPSLLALSCSLVTDNTVTAERQELKSKTDGGVLTGKLRQFSQTPSPFSQSRLGIFSVI